MVDKKYADLSGLITKEGAALLVANELGIKLNNTVRRPSIKDLQSGMKNVSVTGRIFRISDVTGFKKSDGSAGKVANVFIGDETGFVRIPLWNE